MVEEDLTAEVQPHACRLARGLGGEERVEHLADDAGFDAGAVVLQRQSRLVPVRLQRQAYFGGVGLLPVFLRDGVHAVAYQAHQYLAELFLVSLNPEAALREAETGRDAHPRDFIPVVFVDKCLRMAAQRREVEPCLGAVVFLQYLFHGFQDARGVPSVPLYLGEVGREHPQQVVRVLVGFAAHPVFQGREAPAQVVGEAVGQVREVVDVVQRVQDAVYQPARQLAHGGQLFLPDKVFLGVAQVGKGLLQVGRLLLYLALLRPYLFGARGHEGLQPFLVPQQPPQPPFDGQPDQERQQQDVGRQAVPPQVEGPFDGKAVGDGVAAPAEGVLGTHLEGVGAEAQVGVALHGMGAPCAPSLVVALQPALVGRLSLRGGGVGGEAERDFTGLAAEGGRRLVVQAACLSFPAMNAAEQERVAVDGYPAEVRPGRLAVGAVRRAEVHAYQAEVAACPEERIPFLEQGAHGQAAQRLQLLVPSGRAGAGGEAGDVFPVHVGGPLPAAVRAAEKAEVCPGGPGACERASFFLAVGLPVKVLGGDVPVRAARQAHHMGQPGYPPAGSGAQGKTADAVHPGDVQACPVHAQGLGVFMGQPVGGGAVYPVHALGRGGVQGLAVRRRLQLPAGVVDSFHGVELFLPFHVQPLQRADVQPSLAPGKGGHFPFQPLRGGVTGVHRGQVGAEYAVVGHAPEAPVPVIRYLVHAVAAQAVALVEGVQLPPVPVKHNKPLARSGQGRPAAMQGDRVVDFHGPDAVHRPFHRGGHGLRTEIPPARRDEDAVLHGEGLSFPVEDADAPAFLRQGRHLAGLGAAGGHGLQNKIPFRTGGDTGHEMVAAHPDGAARVFQQAGGAGVAGGAQDAPLCKVLYYAKRYILTADYK